MATSFFFYDLETSGISAARDRIMQFAGQRTDSDLKPIGTAFNIAVRLNADILPAPEAILISGISPLKNQQEGISEAEFSQTFNSDIAKAGTIFTGFNNLRFDDEFIRYSNYRNFYDAYSWHWQDDSSRWDLLDVVRMTRALRPDGINWPFIEDNKPSNKLELLTSANKLAHANAHDALSDALATLEVAKLIKAKQPKLFGYLLGLRKKAALAELIKKEDTLVYTSSHYSSEVLHTTVVYILNYDPIVGSAQVIDLREDLESYINLPVDELVHLWEYDPEATRPRLPVKTMKLNRCPAVAPLSVLDKPTITRLNLDMDKIKGNKKLMSTHKEEFAAKIIKVASKLDDQREERRQAEPRIAYVDERLYDKFIPKTDAAKFSTAHELAKQNSNFEVSFEDKRLNDLYNLYRARNYQDSLTKVEKADWLKHVRTKLFEGQPSKYQLYKDELAALSAVYKNEKTKLALLKDLDKYGQTILNDYGAD